MLNDAYSIRQNVEPHIYTRAQIIENEIMYSVTNLAERIANFKCHNQRLTRANEERGEFTLKNKCSVAGSYRPSTLRV